MYREFENKYGRFEIEITKIEGNGFYGDYFTCDVISMDLDWDVLMEDVIDFNEVTSFTYKHYSDEWKLCFTFELRPITGKTLQIFPHLNVEVLNVV